MGLGGQFRLEFPGDVAGEGVVVFVPPPVCGFLHGSGVAWPTGIGGIARGRTRLVAGVGVPLNGLPNGDRRVVVGRPCLAGVLVLGG